MPTDGGAVAFLDAEVLSTRIMRMLLMMASDDLGLPATWSALAEKQGDDHLSPSALRLGNLRAMLALRWLAGRHGPPRGAARGGPRQASATYAPWARPS